MKNYFEQNKKELNIVESLKNFENDLNIVQKEDFHSLFMSLVSIINEDSYKRMEYYYRNN